VGLPSANVDRVWYSHAALNDDGISDRELVSRCRRNQDAAWEVIHRRYRRRVFGMAYKFTGRFEEAEDLSQEIFLKAYRALSTYDEDQDFFGWLVGITRNACIDHYRRAKREKMVLSGDLGEMREIASHGPSPYGYMEAAERAKIVRQGLDELPVDLRTALIMRDLKGLSYREITVRLNISEGTVKSRIHRGRAELARRMKSHKPLGV